MECLFFFFFFFFLQASLSFMVHWITFSSAKASKIWVFYMNLLFTLCILLLVQEEADIVQGGVCIHSTKSVLQMSWTGTQLSCFKVNNPGYLQRISMICTRHVISQRLNDAILMILAANNKSHSSYIEPGPTTMQMEYIFLKGYFAIPL